MNLHRKL